MSTYDLPTSKVLCRYYLNSCCTKGNQCTFSHDITSKEDLTCRFYLRGTCAYGNSCRYMHVRPKKAIAKNGAVQQSIPKPVPVVASLGNFIDESNMVKLKKDVTCRTGKNVHGIDSPQKDPLPEPDEVEEYYFSYGNVASVGLPTVVDEITPEEAAMLLCPFYEMTGECPWKNKCEYMHGHLCDLCYRYCLHPMDPEMQKAHRKSCASMHEKEMQRAFAVQRSEGRTCGICMEVVVLKVTRGEKRFGILSNCEHCFCLSCIRKWRTSHFSKKTIRACPMCREVSFFVIPSDVWIEDPDEKKALIDEYKDNLSEKPCKYFLEGRGDCPFGSGCFYKHAFPDGTAANIVPRVVVDDEGKGKFINKPQLWDFFVERTKHEASLTDS